MLTWYCCPEGFMLACRDSQLNWVLSGAVVEQLEDQEEIERGKGEERVEERSNGGKSRKL